MQKHIQDTFYKFLNNSVSLAEFETWLYECSDLEKNIQPHDYIDLISIDFNDKFARESIHKIIDTYIKFDDFEVLRLCEILENIIVNNEKSIGEIAVFLYEAYVFPNDYGYSKYYS